MNVKFTLNDLQRQRVEDHLALVEQVLRRSIKTNEAVDGMGHDDLYQEGCIALCRAAVSYREEMGAFPSYARTVIRNYLLDRCREIQSARKNLPLLSLDAFAEMGAPEPVSPFHTEDLISDVSSSTLLSHFKNRYHGTARIGIEAMELRVRGYSCADIAKLYQKKPNYIGACISRAAEKLRRERIVREFYTACTEQDTEKSLHRYRFSTIAWRSMNSSLNTFRRQEQRRQSHEFSYQAAHPPPDDAFDALRARLLLHDLFLLADEEQALLIRHRLHGCSLAETARREGMSVKRVRHRLKALYRAYFAQKETKQKEL